MEVTHVSQQPSLFKQGVHDGIPIALGYAPVAMTFGLLSKSVGLSFFETVAMSIFVLAGAGQFIAINLIAVGAGMVEIILTEFVVNIRHLLMSTSLSSRVEEAPAWKKAIYAFGITDETFSVASLKEGKLATSYMYGLVLVAYSSWVISSGVGYVIGQKLPEVLRHSLDIALYCMFIGLLIPAVRKKPHLFTLPFIAGGLNALFILIVHIPTGWSIILSTLLTALVVEWVYAKRRKRHGV